MVALFFSEETARKEADTALQANITNIDNQLGDYANSGTLYNSGNFFNNAINVYFGSLSRLSIAAYAKIDIFGYEADISSIDIVEPYGILVIPYTQSITVSVYNKTDTNCLIAYEMHGSGTSTTAGAIIPRISYLSIPAKVGVLLVYWYAIYT